MLGFIWSFLILSLEYKSPPMSLFLVHPKFSNDKCIDWAKNKGTYQKSCEEANEKEKCEAVFNSIIDVTCSTPGEMNTKLEEVSIETETLFFISEQLETAVDFNNLPRKMNVFMFAFDFENENANANILHKINQLICKSSFDGSQNSILSLARSSLKKEKRLIFVPLRMIGTIGNKVSFISIHGYILYLTSTLNCKNVYLFGTCIDEESTSYIRATNLTIYGNDYALFLFASLGLISVDQLIIDDFKFNDNDNEVRQYHIIYFKNRWEIYYSTISSGLGFWYYNIPYSFANKIGLICYTQNITIEADESTKSLSKLRDLNISVSKYNLINYAPISTLSQKKVIFTTRGFQNFTKDQLPNITFNYDSSDFKVVTTDSDSFIDIEYQPIDSPNGPDDSDDSDGNKWLIIGIIIAAVVVVLIIVIIVVVVIVKKKKKNNSSIGENENADN